MRLGQDVDDSLAAALRQAGLDSVSGAFAFQAGRDLHKIGLGHRRRTRLELLDEQGKSCGLYLKRYDAEPLRVRLRRWWTYGRGVSPALAEFANIAAARRLGVTDMREICTDQEASTGRSFIVLTEVAGQSVERLLPTLKADDAEAHRSLAWALGELAGKLHAGGYVHRDFYACHVFAADQSGDWRLGLIDLARMFRPLWRPGRWRVKDLAQLKYSMGQQWASQWWPVVMEGYARHVGPSAARMQRAIDRKAASIARHAARKQARAKGQQA